MGANGAVRQPTGSGWESAVAAARDQTRALGAGARFIDARGAALPSRIPGWRVHEVLVHLAASTDRVARAVREPGARVRQVTLAEYCSVPATDAEETRRRAVEDAACVALDHSGALLAQAARRLCRQLDAAQPDKIVVMRRGTLPLEELLGLHSLELLGHVGDVATAAAVPAARLCEARALRLAVHLLGGGGLPTRPDASDEPVTGLAGRLCPAAVPVLAG